MLLRRVIVHTGARLKAMHRTRKICCAEQIVIGSGGTSFPGWMSIEQTDLDVTNDQDFLKYWSRGSRRAFLAEHVWEHLTIEQGRIGLKNCYEFLQNGGHIRIAVPDGNFPDKNYIDHVRPGGSGAGADDHKVMYTVESLVDLIESAAFIARPLEYFNGDGLFVASPFDEGDGYIRRCRANDPRNTAQNLAYTSLIIDAVKPE